MLTNDSWKVGKLPVSEATKEKQRQNKPVNTGTRVINNGQRNKYVPVSEVEDYLKDGWVLGRFDVSYNKGKTLSTEAKQKSQADRYKYRIGRGRS